MHYEDILSFWFKQLTPSQWWVKDAELDCQIKNQFQEVHQQAQQCELYHWRANAKGRLAEIIILDQFSRNIFRDTPQAFSCDALALGLAQEAVSMGLDNDLNQAEKSFLYMPYMHSESLAIHEVALTLYEANGVQSSLEFETQHYHIIKQFGRYPHRNAILGRTSTEAEQAFLKQPNSSF